MIEVLHSLQLPRHVEGDIDCRSADGQSRGDVTLQRVADHQQFRRMDMLMLTECQKLPLPFVRGDLHIIEIFQQPRPLQLILLILQFPFRKHHHLPACIIHLASYICECRFDARQRCCRQMQQCLAMFQQFGEHARTQVIARHTHGRFENTDGKGLAAITQVGHITRLGIKQFLFRILTIGCNQTVEVLLHSLEMRLTVPQRVIRIKSNHFVWQLGHIPLIIRLALFCSKPLGSAISGISV